MYRQTNLVTVADEKACSKFRYYKPFSAHSGKLLFPPRLVPAQTSAQAPVGVVHAVFKLTYLGLQSSSALKVQALNNDVARTFSVSEQHIRRGGDNSAIMLRHNVRDYREMRTVVKSYTVFTVVNV